MKLVVGKKGISMGKLFNVLAAVAVAIVMFGFSVNAQEGSEEQYTFGTVVELTDNALVISEWDFETEQDKETVFKLTDATDFEDMTKEEIIVGNEIDVYFYENGDEKDAVLIARPPVMDEGISEEADMVGTETNDYMQDGMMDSGAGEMVPAQDDINAGVY